MENMSYVPLKQPIVFVLEGFDVPPGHGLLLFLLTLLNYMVLLLANGVVVSVIVADRALHRPMYVMVCNLAACDLLGGTAVLVRLMIHFLTGEQRISYVSAIAQAFSVHTYAGAIHTILSAMAYDRYMAICQPLHYHAIMTTCRLVFSCALAWTLALLIIGVLFALNVGTPLCGTTIKHVYCSNRAILRLACGPTPINNIYGLCIAWGMSTGAFLVIAFSYMKILQACVSKSRNSDSRSKAMQTCSTHLVVYVLYEVNGVLIVLSHRFDSQNIRKFCSILAIIIPPAINPIIYGLVTKELRMSIIKQFTTRLTPRQTQGVKSIR